MLPNQTQRLLRLVVAVALLALTGCSVVLDFSDCESDDECPGGTCENGVCQIASCETASECDEGDVCINEICKTVDESFCTIAPIETSGATVYIGVMLPFTGRNATKAEATAAGARTALQQINLTHDGIKGVQLDALECDTEQNAGRAEEVARYLAEDLGVSTIIGSISSGETLAATDVTIPAGTLVMSPGATSPTLTSLDDDDLVWRTIASDALQGPALANMVTDANYEDVLVLSVENAYGQGLFNAFFSSDAIDTDTVQSLTYQVDDNGDLVTDSIVSQASQLFVNEGYLPDAIVIMGSLESQQLIFALDDTFFGEFVEEEKPIWLLSEAGRDPGLLDDRFSAVHPRIQGTFIQTPDSQVYDDFRVRFESNTEFRAEDFPFADKAYDAAFVVALALGATGDPLGAAGSDVASHLANIASGDVFEPGDDIAEAVDALADGGIDYAGASGPVDFEPGTGDVVSDITAWRITDGDDFENLGVVFSVGTE